MPAQQSLEDYEPDLNGLHTRLQLDSGGPPHLSLASFVPQYQA